MRPHRPFTILVTAVLVSGHLLSAQAPQAPRPGPRTGLILGRVVDGATGNPVASATVRLMRYEENEATELAVATGADGQFMFAALQAGRFMLTVRKAGYSPGAAGQSRASGHEDPGIITLDDNARRGDVVIRVWKYSAISGRVVDQSGEPMIGIRVSAFRRTFVAGRPAFDAHGSDAWTDDRGMFRLYRLLPGDYIVGVVRSSRSEPVSAVEAALREKENAAAPGARMTSEIGSSGVQPPVSGRTLRVGDTYEEIRFPPPLVTPAGVMVYPSAFYPGATNAADARVVSVGADEHNGVDIVMRPVRAMTVTGTISDPAGPVANFPVRLVPAEGGGLATTQLGTEWSTVTDARGRYTFASVPAGEYEVSAFEGQPASWEAGVIALSGDDGGAVVTAFEAAGPPSAPKPTRFASAVVTVADSAVTVPALLLSRGVRVSGQLSFSGAAKPPTAEALQAITIMFEPADGRHSGVDFQGTATVDERGRFESLELPPGRYLIRAQVEGWAILSATVAGLDASVTPVAIGASPVSGVDIRFTDRPAVLSGSVTSGRRPGEARGPLVVVFPVDKSGWVDFGMSPRRLVERFPDPNGAFEISGLPVGDYFVAVILNNGLDEWRIPATLEAISRQATRVSLTQGQRSSVTLQVIR